MELAEDERRGCESSKGRLRHHMIRRRGAEVTLASVASAGYSRWTAARKARTSAWELSMLQALWKLLR